MSLVQRIARQGKITFSAHYSALTAGSTEAPDLQPLLALVNELKSSDINLPSNPAVADITPPDSAPAAFIDILRDNHFTIAGFLLRRGSSMPIHDHPNMYGICKVLYGKVIITSFSPPKRIETSIPHSHGFSYYMAKDEGAEFFTAASPCAILTPNSKNLHTICAMEHSAFFDILGPPYNSFENRNCHYYQEVPKTTVFDQEKAKELDGVRVLKRTEQPPMFYTSVKSYRGPPVDVRKL
ncbi:2-aminoethanethiol dioxygenase-like [Corticium candelabrum]|uniref:2-aminoethanethiol dioxygenase-like n=1 Tax=Corticium candelabrum TaxID=121492 RepID=UPI002E26B187|nr:2-aminoethanethiol dioxygenase-like [Corticium candelabrum]